MPTSSIANPPRTASAALDQHGRRFDDDDMASADLADGARGALVEVHEAASEALMMRFRRHGMAGRCQGEERSEARHLIGQLLPPTVQNASIASGENATSCEQCSKEAAHVPDEARCGYVPYVVPHEYFWASVSCHHHERGKRPSRQSSS